MKNVFTCQVSPELIEKHKGEFKDDGCECEWCKLMHAIACELNGVCERMRLVLEIENKTEHGMSKYKCETWVMFSRFFEHLAFAIGAMKYTRTIEALHDAVMRFEMCSKILQRYVGNIDSRKMAEFGFMEAMRNSVPGEAVDEILDRILNPKSEDVH